MLQATAQSYDSLAKPPIAFRDMFRNWLQYQHLQAHVVALLFCPGAVI